MSSVASVVGTGMTGIEAPEALTLRPIGMDDATSCAELSRRVGWPHRREDWEFVIGLGHGVVGERDGKLVATGLWWPYGEGHATVGMIIVAPEEQGAGMGKRLMQALLAQAAERSLMLNATVAGEPLYVRLGFRPCGGVSQYHGHVHAVAAPEPGAGKRLRPGSPADLARLERLDREATGLERGPVLAALLQCGNCLVLEQAGQPVGFSILRAFGRGQVIGPVVAVDETDARTLIACWLHGRAGQFIRVDLPLGSGLGDWLVQHGLAPAGDVTAMVRGDLPVASGPARLHALVTQALG
ncbi:Acetyltransferase (GNAT) domain-containing protein [Bosea sp. 62]|uniref:GNAT family N-acetyltransferase n=1 Tax=unclassified Bosea (in: a-proteobacteria) TaxID=2653178 RepID=UPI00125A2E85|nr:MULTISPECIES: GNAT family N-acetyltransferase [unclassified Bosea (in: a-proteobacteria)]CAD5293170.1 Acetyltransferase (GNAT) domain-containing protein [Bosea sp. 21B]CAD5293744.1 Acetyltransferase (GNAT) domain-containing protein [Bosea sp. 46]CAD5299420.1 Acetyltransferase (GNAT) domain-containing protein [Bosea sp. 7B]VVT62190.1 Acetyltransferase (GNAT) domain-containing protein [Bosea sp. EC-HK365B]VXB10012.1 Acetyltransferase (GNAT) domain-containing protein [Bosea sp. 125]